jgi:hypothetical protein
MPDDYQHDVFISYKRDPIQDAWLRDHFVRLFSSAVREEITAACGRLPAGIFFDQAVISDENRKFDLNGIDPGQQWRDALADALKSSRCLVALWSPLYFFSEWCKTEWTTFRKRSDQLRRDLVIGISVYDGENFPADAKAGQRMNFSDYNIIGAGYEKTELYVKFQQEVKLLAKYVAAAVSKAPPFTEWSVVGITPPVDPPEPEISQPLL